MILGEGSDDRGAMVVINGPNSSASSGRPKTEVLEDHTQFILDGCYHRYPNTTGIRYQLKLYKNQFVFQAKGSPYWNFSK